MGFKFEELNVYQESLVFIDQIYQITNVFPKDELFGLTNQLRRAAISIALNIAEGSSRTRKDFRHFLDIARGSCYECAAIFTIIKHRNYISGLDLQNLYDHCNKIARMVSALKNSLL